MEGEDLEYETRWFFRNSFSQKVGVKMDISYKTRKLLAQHRLLRRAKDW